MTPPAESCHHLNFKTSLCHGSPSIMQRQVCHGILADVQESGKFAVRIAQAVHKAAENSVLKKCMLVITLGCAFVAKWECTWPISWLASIASASPQIAVAKLRT